MPETVCLELASIIGFEGNCLSSLHVHQDGENIVYPLGTIIIVQSRKTRKQKFLVGHTNNVSTVCISKTGKYIGSGQMNHMGFRADVILWCYNDGAEVGRHRLHRVKVESIGFSCDDIYMATLGGQDDGNVIVYDVEKREPLCGYDATLKSQGYATALTFSTQFCDIFATAGEFTIRLWRIDPVHRNVRPMNCQLNAVKRIIRCLKIDSKDEFMYCGTSTGDVLKFRLNIMPELPWGDSPPRLVAVLAKTPKKKARHLKEGERYTMGIWALKVLPHDHLLLGTGSGRVVHVREAKCKRPAQVVPFMKRVTDGLFDECACVQVTGRVTSFSIHDDHVLIGTAAAQIYDLALQNFHLQLMDTCHSSEIRSVVFPKKCSDLFVTSGLQEVRIWHTTTGRELLRIPQVNMTCQCVVISPDGSRVLSGWDDGTIRAFSPEKGLLLFIIRNGHNRGVTALASTDDNCMIISGGGEGAVRAWNITPNEQKLLAHMKEHRGAVTAIKLTKCCDQCVSCSTDGSCCIWDLKRMQRVAVLLANTLFTGICYHPSEAQVITCGTDRKVAYWEVLDGSLIRELEASQDGALNALDITPDGQLFVTGGDEKLIKVYRYCEGDVIFKGIGHSTAISDVCISPDMKTVVSVGTDGAILCWKLPPPPPPPEPVPPPPEVIPTPVAVPPPEAIPPLCEPVPPLVEKC